MNEQELQDMPIGSERVINGHCVKRKNMYGWIVNSTGPWDCETALAIVKKDLTKWNDGLPCVLLLVLVVIALVIGLTTGWIDGFIKENIFFIKLFVVLTIVLTPITYYLKRK